MIGVCLGAYLASRGTANSWKKWLPKTCFAMGICLGLSGVSSSISLPSNISFACVFVAYLLAGICGGFYIIPVSSFIQLRPNASCKGRVLGTSNCLSFTAILLAGPIFWLLDHINPAKAHFILALMAFSAGFFFWYLIKRVSDFKIDSKE